MDEVSGKLGGKKGELRDQESKLQWLQTLVYRLSGTMPTASPGPLGHVPPMARRCFLQARLLRSIAGLDSVSGQTLDLLGLAVPRGHLIFGEAWKGEKKTNETKTAAVQESRG